MAWQQQNNAQASDNVWIGDIPAALTKEDIFAIFSAYGTVSSCRPLPARGAKGAALVRFGSVEEATWVVTNLNGNLAEGLDDPLIVRFANSTPGGGGGGGGGGWKDNEGGGGGGKAGGGGSNKSTPYGGKGGGGKGGGKAPVPGSFFNLYGAIKKAGLLGGVGAVPQECTVYIKNLPSDTTDVDLYKLFAPFGAIAPSGVKAMMNEDGSCKGFGFIDFVDPACAQTAIATLNAYTLPDGSAISVSGKLPSKKDGSGKGGKGGAAQGPSDDAAQWQGFAAAAEQ